MKITDKELNIENVLLIAKSKNSICSYITKKRNTDSFVYVLSGKAKYTDNNKTFIAKKDSLIYLARNSEYRINVLTNDYTFIVVNFLFRESKSILLDNDLFSFNNYTGIENLFLKLLKLFPISTVESNLKINSILYEIYSKICKITSNEYLTKEVKDKIQIITENIINECLNDDFNLSNIIKNYDISEVHFRRLFKKIYNSTPIKFVQNIRINKSKQLLLDKSIPINKIAKMCGYTDSFYFSRAFKLNTGITPTKYRDFSQQ